MLDWDALAHRGKGTSRFIRERVSAYEAPNFRDHGMLVELYIKRLILRLQRRYGWACLSDAVARRLIWEDTGHMMGVGTFYAASVRMCARGELIDVWLTRGNVHPNWGQIKVGCHMMRVPIGAREQMVARGFNEKHAHKPYRNMTQRFDPRVLLAQLGAASRPVVPSSAEAQEDRERASRDAWIEKLRQAIEADRRAAGHDPDTGKPS